jgi:hypothetical protein
VPFRTARIEEKDGVGAAERLVGRVRNDHSVAGRLQR